MHSLPRHCSATVPTDVDLIDWVLSHVLTDFPWAKVAGNFKRALGTSHKGEYTRYMYELIKAAQKASAAQLPRAHSPSSLRSNSARTQNFLEEMRRKQTHHFVEFCKVHAGLCWGFVETPRGQSRLVTINSLRELYTEGYWPDHADISLLSILLLMPNPRIALLQFHPSYRGESFHVVPSAPAGTFLPHLQRLEIASLLPGDHLLSLLPSGLEKLAVIEYPPLSDPYRYPKNVLTSSAFLDSLSGVYLPAVTHLKLGYVTYASD
ncbi:hypothetical protein B0H13DRAFT_2672021 [Mycena leptocephala]|nr:hypothetical protein B0H13DRAFT_2672021 [Mycena leptocephala]